MSVGERSVSVTGGQQRQEGISNNIHLRLHTRGAYEVSYPYLQSVPGQDLAQDRRREFLFCLGLPSCLTPLQF